MNRTMINNEFFYAKKTKEKFNNFIVFFSNQELLKYKRNKYSLLIVPMLHLLFYIILFSKYLLRSEILSYEMSYFFDYYSPC